MVQDGPTGGGTVLNQNLKEVNSSQQNNYASNDGSRPWDILEDQKPQAGPPTLLGRPSSASTPPPTSRRSTRRERDCQNGQNGYSERQAQHRSLPAGQHRGSLECAGLPDPEPGRHRRQRRYHRQQPAGALGRDLQVARARHRQPGGRAMSAFRAGHPRARRRGPVRLLRLLRRTRSRNPYEFQVFDDVNNLKPKSPVRIAGVEVGKVKKVEPVTEGEGAAKVTIEMEDEGLPIKEDAAQDPPAHLPRGQLLRRLPAGHPGRGGASTRAEPSRLPRRPRGAARRRPHRAPARHPHGPPDVPARVLRRPRRRRSGGLQRVDPLVGARYRNSPRQRRHARPGRRPRPPARALGPAEDFAALAEEDALKDHELQRRGRRWPPRTRRWPPRSRRCATRCGRHKPALARSTRRCRRFAAANDAFLACAA